MAELLPSTAFARFRSRFDDVATPFANSDVDIKGKRKYVVERVERLAFTEKKNAKRKRHAEIEEIDGELLAELQRKEAKMAELVAKVSELRESVPGMFDDVKLQATKRAKTRETSQATPSKPRPPRAETPAKPDLYLEKLHKGAEKLKLVGAKFLEDQKSVDKIYEKQRRTRFAAENPGGRIIPSLGAPQTPNRATSAGASQRSRLASLMK